MNLETRKVAELLEVFAPYNPRRISDHDFEALRRSLRLFGTVEPIVVNQRSGRIVGGHQRVRAAQAEGIEELPVVFVDLDEQAERQLNLALNRIHGEWDEDKLEEVLRSLEAQGADLDLTGFGEDELEKLLGTDSGPVLPDEEGDGYRSQFGVIVICADEAEQETVFNKLQGEGYQVKVVVT